MPFSTTTPYLVSTETGILLLFLSVVFLTFLLYVLYIIYPITSDPGNDVIN